MLEDFTSEKDISNIRIIPFDKNKIIAKREDPYGFWSISFERGSPPDWLKGLYTSFDKAYLDIRKYLHQRNSPVPERIVDI